MSVNVHPLRDEPAGAEFPVPGAQYLGVAVRTEFAILPAARGWADAQADRWSELFRMEPEVIRGTTGGPPVVGGVAGAGGTVEAIELPAEPGIEAEGAVLESYRRVRMASGGVTVEARFVNYRPVPSALRARASGTWHRTDLAGEVLEEDVDLGAYEIPPARIVTFRRAE